MLTEEEWNALDDDEKQDNNYLDYKNRITKESGQSPADAVSNQQLKLTIPERVGQIKQAVADKWKDASTQQEKNAAIANDASFASPDVKQQVFAPQNNKEKVAGEAYINANAADIAEGTGFDKTDIVKNASAAEIENDPTKLNEAEKELNSTANPSPQVQESMVDKAVSGKLDKSDKGYLIANAIATFARNLGKDIGNVAAAYSGGAQDWNHETSLLEDRMAQKAQAGTEEEIMNENPNSRLGQMLRSSNIDIATKSGRLQLANRIKSALYNEDGSPKYDPQSPAFARLATLYNQISSGGGQQYSIMDTLATVGNEWLSKLFY